jgi:replicative DNA helicase
MSPAVTMRKIASIILRKQMKIQCFSAEDNFKFNKWSLEHKVYVNNNTLGTDINTLGSQLLRAKELGVEFVMLDHLDYIVRSRRQEMHEAIEETVKRLHELAVELQMHFFLICHIKQSANSSEEAGLHSIKGSSAIKQYADNIIVLFRCSRTDPQADPDKVKIKIVKNRMFGLEGSTFLFYQPDWEGYVPFKPES